MSYNGLDLKVALGKMLKHPAWAMLRDERTCRSAALGGHLELLQWARSDPLDPCPWDKYTALNAANFGHLKVLKWAIENGCPYDINKLKYCGGHHKRIRKYLETL